MIKNNSGITLMILIVTIILLLILTGIGINLSFDIIDDVRNSKLEVELGVVRQAVIEYYEKMEILGKTEGDAWIIGSLVENKIYVRNNVTNPFENYDYNNFKPQDRYYRLYQDDLKKLGVDDVGEKEWYIVNYSTGEVYNESQQTYHGKDELIYLPPVNYNNQLNTEDTETFNDWPNEFDDE